MHQSPLCIEQCLVDHQCLQDAALSRQVTASVCVRTPPIPAALSALLPNASAFHSTLHAANALLSRSSVPNTLPAFGWTTTQHFHSQHLTYSLTSTLLCAHLRLSLEQVRLPTKPPPRGNVSCAHNCNNVGNCNYDTGVCQCPAGESVCLTLRRFHTMRTTVP